MSDLALLPDTIVFASEKHGLQWCKEAETSPCPVIVSVTLGPKHVTPVDQIERMLQCQGINAAVAKSALTYR